MTRSWGLGIQQTSLGEGHRSPLSVGRELSCASSVKWGAYLSVCKEPGVGPDTQEEEYGRLLHGETERPAGLSCVAGRF